VPFIGTPKQQKVLRADRIPQPHRARLDGRNRRLVQFGVFGPGTSLTLHQYFLLVNGTSSKLLQTIRGSLWFRKGGRSEKIVVVLYSMASALLWRLSLLYRGLWLK